MSNMNSFGGVYQPNGPVSYFPGDSGHKPPAGMATWALVLAIVPFPPAWIAAVALACIALGDIKHGSAAGKGRAIAALVVVALWVAGVAAAIVTGAGDDGGPAKRAATGTIPILKARVGDCLGEMPGTGINLSLEVVPCERAHPGEVYAVFELDVENGANQAQIDRFAEGGCAKRFETFIGTPFQRSELDVMYLPPIARNLDVDQGVICIVAETDRSVTGSLKGVAR